MLRRDAHRVVGPPGCGIPTRQAICQHLDDTTHGVALLAARLHLSNHPLARGRVSTTHRISVNTGQIRRFRPHILRTLDRPEGHDMGQHIDVEGLFEEGLGN